MKLKSSSKFFFTESPSEMGTVTNKILPKAQRKVRNLNFVFFEEQHNFRNELFYLVQVCDCGRSATQLRICRAGFS